jgi:putative ABC transport system permease protein
LAWRRSVRVATATTILAVATAVPAAIAAYGATATDSISVTADAQLRFNLGSDTVVSYDRPIDRELDNLPPPPPVPASMAGRATEVLRLNQQQLGGLIVDVLAVDPATFTDGAFWDARIGGPSLADAVGRLTTDAEPAVVASRTVPPGPSTLTVRGEQVPVQVADTRPLPAAQSAYPLVVIDRDALTAHLSPAALGALVPQVWIAGDPQQTLVQVAQAGLPASRVVTIDEHRAGAIYEPVTYTFQYLIALSVFTGLIGAVGLLLYLDSRTTAHRRAYVMLRRLGLSAPTHRRALLLEVTVPMLAGLACGLASAIAIAYLLRSGFDLAPDRFPDTLVELPTTMAATVTAAAVTIAAGAALLTHARIARANPAEVLRDTT